MNRNIKTSRSVLMLTSLYGGLMIGCEKPSNIRMRLAAMIPGPPERLVGVDAENRVTICDPATQDVLATFGTGNAQVRGLRVTADGIYIAVVGDNGKCDVIRSDTGSRRISVTMPGSGRDDVGAAAFSPDGRHLFVGGVGSIDVYALSDGARVRRIPDDQNDHLYADSTFEKLENFSEARILSMDVKPASDQVLIGTDVGALVIDYVKCKVVWQSTTIKNKAVDLVRYAPNGSDFVLNDSSGKLHYFKLYEDVQNFQPGDLTTNRPIDAVFTSVEFSPDGAFLTALGTDGAFRVIDLIATKVIKKVTPGNLDVRGLALSAAGRYAWIGSQGNVERFTRLTLPNAMWATNGELD